MKPATTSAASGIEDRQPQPGARERDDDGDRRPDVTPRLHRIGEEHLAAEPLAFALIS